MAEREGTSNDKQRLIGIAESRCLLHGVQSGGDWCLLRTRLFTGRLQILGPWLSFSCQRTTRALLRLSGRLCMRGRTAVRAVQPWLMQPALSQQAGAGVPSQACLAAGTGSDSWL